MNWRRLFISVVAVVICYLSGPYWAGTFQVGELSGPVVYPEAYHSIIFIITHEGYHNEKPRVALDGWMYWRPLFYGMPRRLKSEQERMEYIEMARRNKSPGLRRMIEENARIQSR